MMMKPVQNDKSVYFYDRNIRMEFAVNFLGDRATAARIFFVGDEAGDGAGRYIGRDDDGWVVPEFLPNRDMILRILKWVEKS